MMEPLLIGIGGAFGAVSRYIVGLMFGRLAFPWATLAVNGIGSLVLAFTLVLFESQDWFLVVGVGFCGAFTTFSTFSYQTVYLWELGNRRTALVNATANLAVCVVAFGAVVFLFT